MPQTTLDQRTWIPGLRRLMDEHDRGPTWVTRRLRAQGVDVDVSTVWRWSVNDNRAPLTMLAPLAAVFGVKEKELLK